MSLIAFQDLPNTTTPVNADNLNNNFEYLDDNDEELNNMITALNIYRKDEVYNENEAWQIAIDNTRGACLIIVNSVSSTDNKGIWIMFSNVSGSSNVNIVPIIDNIGTNIIFTPLSNMVCKIKPRWYSRISVIPLIGNVSLTKLINS